MINEREEFLAYTEQPIYSAKNKRDTAYMGRFTFDMLLDFEGLSRVLTIVARGYMWQGEEPDIERAARALRAWCSVPDSKKASPKEDWQYQTQPERGLAVSDTIFRFTRGISRIGGRTGRRLVLPPCSWHLRFREGES